MRAIERILAEMIAEGPNPGIMVAHSFLERAGIDSMAIVRLWQMHSDLESFGPMVVLEAITSGHMPQEGFSLVIKIDDAERDLGYFDTANPEWQGFQVFGITDPTSDVYHAAQLTFTASERYGELWPEDASWQFTIRCNAASWCSNELIVSRGNRRLCKLCKRITGRR